MKKKIFIIGFILVALGFATYKFLLPSNATSEPIDNNGLKTTTLPKPSSGTPSDYDALDNLFIAAWVMENATSFETHTYGTVTANVAFINYVQEINDTRLKSDGMLFTEAISTSSLKSVAEQRFFCGSKYLVRYSKGVSGNTATWQDSVSGLTEEEHTGEYGSVPNSISKYILTKETITNSTFLGQDENGNYMYEYITDANIAISNYSHEVKHMGGASSYPTFYRADLIITIDNNWNPISVRAIEKYDLPILGGITCNLDSTETISNINADVNIPEKDFFLQYLDNEDIYNGGNANTKDATTYLMEAFTPTISGVPLSLCGTIKINDKVLDVKFYFEMNNMTIKLLINDEMYVEYKDNIAKIKYKNLNGYVDGETFISSLDPSLSDNEEINNILALFNDPSFLENMMKNTTISEDSGHVLLSMPITFEEHTLYVSFSLENANNMCKLNSITADFAIQNIDLNVEFFPMEFNLDEYEFENDLTNLSSIINPLTSILTNGGFECAVNITIPFEDNNLIIDATLESDLEKCLIEGRVIYNEEIFDITLYYEKETIYLAYKDVKIKTSVNDSYLIIENLLNTLKIDLNNSSLPNTSINDVYFEDNILKIIINDQTICIENCFDSIELSSPNCYATVKPKSDILISYDTTDYIDISHITYFEDVLLDIYDKKNVAIENINIIYENIEIKGNIYIDFQDKIKAYALLDIYYLGDTIPLQITYVDDVVYLDIFNIHISGNFDDIYKIINSYIPSDSSDINFDGIIHSLTSADNLLVFGLTIMNNNLNVKLAKDNNNIKVEIDKIGNLTLSSNSIPISKPNSDYIDISTLMPYFDLIDTIINNNYLSINDLSLNYLYNDININVTGDLGISFEQELIINANLIINLIYNNDSYMINLDIVNNVCYLSYENIKLKADISEILDIINDFDIQTSSNEYSIDITELLNSIIVSNSNIQLEYDLSSISPILKDVKMSLSNYNDKVSATIKTTNIQFNGTLNATDYCANIPQETYNDFDIVSSLINNLKEIIKNKSITVTLSNTLLDYNEITAIVDGQMNVNFQDENNLIINAWTDIELIYDNNSYAINIKIIDNDFYFVCENIYLHGNINEISSIIKAYQPDNNSTSISLNYIEILKSISIDDDTIYLSTNLPYTDDTNLSIDVKNDNLNLLVTSSIINTNIEISSDNLEITKGDYDYTEITNFTSITDLVDTILKERTINVNNLSLEYYDDSLYIILTGYMNINIDDYFINANLDIEIIENDVSYLINIKIIDNTIYIKVNNILLEASFDEIDEIITPIINTINRDETRDVKDINFDLKEIISSIIISDNNINLSTNLSNITSLLGDTELNIWIVNGNAKVNITSNEVLEKNSLKIAFDINDEKHNPTVNEKYVNIKSFSNLFTLINNSLDTKSISLTDISFEANNDNLNIKVNGDLMVDISKMDDFVIDGKFDVMLDYNNVNYIIKLTIVENVFYIEFNDVKISITLDELIQLINEFTVSNQSLDFNSMMIKDVLETLTIENNILNGMFNLDSDSLFFTFDFDSSILAISTSSFTLTSNVNNEIIQVNKPNGTFSSLTNIKPLISDIITMFEQKKLTINDLVFTLKINETDIIVEANIHVDFSDSSNVKLAAEIILDVDNFVISFEILHVDNSIYLKWDDVIFMIKDDEIDNLIDKINETFGLAINQSETSSNTNINYMILESLIIDDSSLNATINLEQFVTDLLVLVNIDFQDELAVTIPNTNMSYNNSDISFNLAFNISECAKEIKPFEQEKINDINDISLLLDFVKEIVDLATIDRTIGAETPYNMTFSTTITKEENDIQTITNINGYMYITVHSNGLFDAYLNLSIDGNNSQPSHYISFTIKNDGNSSVVYATYYSDKGSEENSVKMMMQLENMLTIASTVTTFMGIKNTILDQILNSGAISLDISTFDKLNISIIDPNKKIYASDYLKDISIDNSLTITLNKEPLKLENDLVLTINRETFGTKTIVNSVNIGDLYQSNGNTNVTYGNMKIALDRDSFGDLNVEVIEEPTNLSSYKDFSSLKDFIEAFLNTATDDVKNAGYSLKGNLTLDFDSAFLGALAGLIVKLPNINVSSEITVNSETGLPSIHVNLSNIKKTVINLLVTKYTIINADTETDLWYENNTFYIKRVTSTETLEYIVSYNDFMENIEEWMYFMFNFGDWIISKINSSESDTETYPMRFDKVFKEYTYDGTKYFILLDGNYFVGGDSVGDINLYIYTTTDNGMLQLKQFTGTVSLVSLITATFDISLDNLIPLTSISVNIPDSTNYISINKP